MTKYHFPLHLNHCYHVFNQAVGDELLFRNEQNYEFFLKKYALHTERICDTFSYSLLPDHFHFVIKIKSMEECSSHFEKTKKSIFECSQHDISDFLMERFPNLCNSYTKSYNKIFLRKGALFIDYTKRREISDEVYFCDTINYIHFNSVYHRLSKTPLEWKWSSFRALLTGSRTKVKRNETLNVFGSLSNYRMKHRTMVKPLSEYEFL